MILLFKIMNERILSGGSIVILVVGILIMVIYIATNWNKNN